MKTTRTFASICLSASCIALFAATNVSVGDQPGVFRMASSPEDKTPPPVQNGLQPIPDGHIPGQFVQNGAAQFNLNRAPNGQGVPIPGNQPQFVDPSQFLQRSAGVTSPIMGPQAFAEQPLVGPQATFEQNIDSGLGFQDSYTRINARIPNHLIPNTTVISMDLSASLSAGGDDLYNYGAVYRHYDEQRNRIWGINVFGDFDNTTSLSEYSRAGFGLENLGRYIDFILNGYLVTGNDTVLSSRTSLPNLTLQGNNVVRSFMETRENAYSGFDAKMGGPLPWLGRRGVNGYVGTYYLNSDFGAEEALGVSAEVQVLATESLEVNAYYTNDEVFGTNSWVSLAYTIPNTRERRILRPKTVRERLTDPVRRTNTIHSKTETVAATEAVINPKTGLPWTLVYVDPNATSMGTGTVETPFMTLQAASDTNVASIDAIRVTPRADDTALNLTVAGGIDLFSEQALFSSHKDFTLFTEAGGDFIIPSIPTLTGMGPLIQDPTIVAGGAVIRVTDWNRISGLRIDAANSTSTDFGIGIDGTAVEGIHVACNTFLNYTVGANILSAEDQLLFDDNVFTGLAGVSETGLNVETRPGSTSELRIARNTATDNATAAINVTAGSGSTINADNPNGFGLLPPDPTAAPGPGGIPVPIFGPGAVEATGIVDNQVSAGGDGIVVTAETGATINAVVERNTSTDNTFNGFIGRADGGTINLVSMRENTFSSNLENGGLLHFLNGGTITSLTEDVNGDGILNPSEDTNGNGILDPAEDTNGNGILDPGEDTNGNGVLDPAEDLDGDGLIAASEDINGNGLLDQGIVSNTMSDNGLTGLCLFGEDASTGDFDIGGPFVGLGNTFSGNTGAGIAVDLQDSSTAGIDALFNTISGGSSGPASLTIVLDFIDAAQGSVVDANGRTVNPFDVTNFGFAAGDFDTVTNAVLQTVQNSYAAIPTAGTDTNSPIPDGFALDVDFVIGDTGVAPSNGATEYYVVTIGDLATPTGGLLGQAADIGNIRNAMGQGPGMGLFGTPQANGASSSAVYASEFSVIGGLNPPTAHAPTELWLERPLTVAETTGLTSGNLTATRYALGNVTSHEVGHTLSLRHVQNAGAVTPTGVPPIMGTGAIDQPNQAFIEPAEFAYSGTNPGEIPGEAPFTQNTIAQLATAVGLRTAGSPQANGITIVANDSARLRPSTFIENTISGSTNRGLNIEMNDMAVAESVTIQGNDITGNGTGIRLAANGPDAIINADNTVGGTDMNLLGGSMFAQGNTITNGTGDGFQAAVADGGTVVGNLLNNNISNNGGNGASFVIERGGTIDFGTSADRIISGNTFDQNAGHGIFVNSNVDETVTNTGQAMDLVIQGNSITGNQTGGIFAELNGLNHIPPGPPVLVPATRENNVLNLTIGQTTAPFGTPVTAESNTITGNGGVGVGVVVGGTGLADVSVVQNIITGTTTGTDPLFNGDGINLIRRDSSLLLADIFNNTVTGNASNGLEVDTQGTNKVNQNQPMSGTVNSVTWNNNILDNNSENGVAFRTRGDSQLFADGSNNFVRNNAVQGIDIETTETSSFGDPSVVVPGALGRRVLFDGNTVTDNGVDGLWATADEGSYLLLEVTSTQVPTVSGAHAALNTNGDSNYSRNGFDGIHIDAFGGFDGFGGSTVDVKITADTGSTFIQDNGTSDFAFGGVFVDARGTATGEVNVMNSVITGTVAGASEDTNGNGVLDAGEDLNGNGTLDDGEDTNGNGVLDLAEDLNGNNDIDVLGGDGIAYNSTDSSDVNLTVGGAAGMGNVIQGNGDDGIAITLTNTSSIVRGITTPEITISNNLIGGESSGVAAGNAGDGISIASFGLTEAGNPTPGFEGGLNYAGIGVPAGAGELPNQFTQGPAPTITVDANTISRNNRNGVNIRLNGANGLTNLRPNPLEPNLALINRITLTDNVIVSNGEHGVTMRADTDMNQNRNVFLEPIIIPAVPPALDPTLEDNQDFTTGNVFNNNLADPLGYDPNDLFPGTYLNLQTVQNTLLTVTGNTIQGNGTNTVVGRGLELLVGTGAYVGADVQDNIFGGNLEQDLFTNSFLSTEEEVFASIDNGGGTLGAEGDATDDAALYDVVFLEDAALLDMRFTNNTGDQILITGLDGGAEYAATDPLKAPPTGNVIRHFAEVFKIDGSGTGDLATNTFVELGVPQNVQAAFGAFRIQNLSTEVTWPEDPFVDAD